VQTPPPVIKAAPPAQTEARTAKPIGALGYIGYIFLMGLPGVGLVLSILWGMKKERTDKRSLARAMILFSILSIVLCVAMGIMIFIYTQVVADLHFKIFGIIIF
jgi:hypothetical protein